MSQLAPIEIMPYSATWLALFQSEAALIKLGLAPWLAGEPEHIGSTAVPGLAAKPVIDIMAPVSNLEVSLPAIQAAEKLGYCYAPYKSHQMHWFCKPSPVLRTHHLHLVEHSSGLWRERLAFRDALRESAELAREYQNLKYQLSLRYSSDRDAYTEGKTTFIQQTINARMGGAGAA